MKRLQDHLRPETGADGNLQEEKRRIYEEFKSSSARARQCALENNRRRRALEERQKRWNTEEEQTRQKIIQQRKQRINNATRRFQKCHLPSPPPHPPPHPPPPRRCMQFPRTNLPTVEEALIEIQSKLDSCNFQSSFSTSSYRKSRTHASSPNPIKPQSSHHEALTAVEAISQPGPVKSKTGVISHQEPEKQQDGSPQDSHLSDNCDSESLSSKDSLENADPEYKRENARSSSYLRPPFGSQKARAGPASFTEVIVLGDNVSNSEKPHSSQQKRQEAVEEFILNKIQAADDSTSNVFQEERLKQMGWKTPRQKPPTESSATINNFSKILNSACRTEKLNMTTSVKQTLLNNSEWDAPKSPQQPEGGAQKLLFSAAVAHPGKKVTFNEGGLKNQYGSLSSAFENDFGHFTFSKNLASMIRDSIELTKVKNKELWGNNKVKQKGCWFYEEQTKENNSNNHKADHRLNHNRVPGVSRPYPHQTPPASTAYRFPKQAWEDVGVQVRLHKERAQEVTVPLNGHGGGSKSPQRKGTIYVQPQTAAAGNPTARAQGKKIISHPARRRMASEEKVMDVDHTHTDEQISQIWHSVCSALSTQHAKTTIKTNALDSERVKRKPHLERSRLLPDSGNRHFQRTFQTTEPVRLPPSPCDGIFPVKGLIVPKVPRSKVYADRLEASDFAAAVGRGQKHGPGMVQKPPDVHHGLGTISMEEHRVLLSLERLDQLLQCVGKHSDQHVQNCSPSVPTYI